MNIFTWKRVTTKKQTNKQKHGEATRNLGRFQFVRTDRPEHSRSNDNFPFNQNSPARSVKSWMASTEETVFQQKLLEKAYFVIKLTGRAMVRPDSFDKWTAPLYFNFKTLFQTLSWLFQLVQFVTVRLLEPGHLEEDHPVTRFMKTKDSQVFCKRTNNFHKFKGCFLRGQVSSNGFKFSTLA